MREKTLMINLRLKMVEIGRRLYEREMIAGAQGNISVKLDDTRILTTPSGFCKGRLSPEDVVEVNLKGQQRRMNDHKPSLELPMHLAVYQARADVKAIVHAHPLTATAFALTGIPFDRNFLPEIVLMFGTIPIAAYARPGSAELADIIRTHIKNHDALLMANHGALTVGKDLDHAYDRMETLEHYAKTLYIAHQLNTPHELTKEQIEQLRTLAR